MRGECLITPTLLDTLHWSSNINGPLMIPIGAGIKTSMMANFSVKLLKEASIALPGEHFLQPKHLKIEMKH